MIKTFKADIVFLVDTSSLVGVLDFRSQKQFVKSMAKSLNVAPENSRAAIVTYGSTSSQPDSSAMHVSLSSFDRAVDGSQYIGGPRRMHYAIDIADALLRTARANVSKVVFLLTGGKQSFLQDVPLLKQSFKTLSASGTDVFVITIGSDHEKRELLPGVRRPEDIFAVTSFETLLQHAWNTSKAIAERVGKITLFQKESKKEGPLINWGRKRSLTFQRATLVFLLSLSTLGWRESMDQIRSDNYPGLP